MSDGQYRVGRKLGRTLYWQAGPEASDDDDCIGMLDETYIAKQIAQALNGSAAVRRLHQRGRHPSGFFCTHCGAAWPCYTMLALDGPDVVIQGRPA